MAAVSLREARIPEWAGGILKEKFRRVRRRDTKEQHSEVHSCSLNCALIPLRAAGWGTISGHHTFQDPLSYHWRY